MTEDRCQTWSEEQLIKSSHCLPDNEKNQALAAIQRQTLPAKNTLKYY